MHKYGPVIKMLSLVTQIGITMLTSVFLCMEIVLICFHRNIGIPVNFIYS